MRLVLRPVQAILLALAFFRDLVISSLQVARTVLAEKGAAAPRFVVVPLAEAQTGLEITLVADPATESRTMGVQAVGPRWDGIAIEALLASDEGGRG